jgi:hypothetical protein
VTRLSALGWGALIVFVLTAWKGALGFVLAVIGIGLVYLVSVTFNPRVRHRACKGTGEVRSWLFPWTFHRCPRCTSGRLVRFGAGHFGMEHARREYRAGLDARARARDEHRFR